MGNDSFLIYKKITAVMSELNAISKDNENRQQGFKFRGIDDVLNELHPRLAKHGIFIVPEVLEERREERQTKTGGVMTYVILKIKYTFFAEDGSNIVAIMIGEGADSGDKASNKAQSIALKYACLQVFAIPTADNKDPDGENYDLSGKALPPSEPKPPNPKSPPLPPSPPPFKASSGKQICSCGEPMMVSQYPDAKFPEGFWYCKKCKTKVGF